MASRSISGILWTLVSVNFFTLIIGGLITWLGYTIPARLKQVGLLPELVIVAGSASLLVACVGLCALNYSSPTALQIYACSCGLFVLMLVLGIPESWYKSSQFVRGTLLLDIIYFSLLSLLLLLLVFALTLAHHLRRKERRQQLHQQQLPLGNVGSSAAGCERLRGGAHQLLAGHASRAGCTCVMITPPLANGGAQPPSLLLPPFDNEPNASDSSDDGDNSNQNMQQRQLWQPRAASTEGSIIERWFSRLKPSQRLLKLHTLTQQPPPPPTTTTMTNRIQQQQAQLLLRPNSQQSDHRQAHPHPHHHRRRLLADRSRQRPRSDHQADHYRRSSSATCRSSSNNNPYQSSGSSSLIDQSRQPTACSCSCTQVTPLAAPAAVPPLVVRGIYSRQQQQRLSADWRSSERLEAGDRSRDLGRRSAGNLCGISDEFVRRHHHHHQQQQQQYEQDDDTTTPPIEEGHYQCDQERDGLLSQDDTSVRYAAGQDEAYWPAPMRRTSDHWPMSSTTTTAAATKRARSSKHSVCSGSSSSRHRASHANYFGQLGCNCSSMSEQQQQHQESPLPMINSSSSVYSICGSGAGTTTTTAMATATTKTSMTNRNYQQTTKGHHSGGSSAAADRFASPRAPNSVAA